MSDVAFDRRRLMAEIEAEVRERREAGAFPPGFEEELDALFDRYAPPSAVDDFDAVLEQTDARVHVDGNPPLESRRRAFVFVKRVLAKLSFWYVRVIALRITEFNAAITRAVRLLGRRVDRLERAVGAVDERVQSEVSRAAPPASVGPWGDAIAELLSGTTGRVLVAESGDAGLLRALVAAGLDAYGAEPRRSLVDDAVLGGLEVRHEGSVEHLRAIPVGALGAVVLAGCTERLSAGDLVDLAQLASTRLAPGGRVVVVSATAARWGEEHSALEVDLSPARPLQPSTWSHLLGGHGIGALEVREADDAPSLERVPGDDAATAALNRNLERLATHAFAPSSYLVTGVRER